MNIKYSVELSEKICALIVQNWSIRKICAQPWAPSIEGFFHMINNHPEFLRAYRIAKQEQAELFADEIMSISDSDPKTDKDGNVDKGDILHKKLKVDSRKWVAGKVRPYLYGEFQRTPLPLDDDGKHISFKWLDDKIDEEKQ